MARVVCQVRTRPERVTLLWSEGPASFEPYHLTGPEVPELHQLAGHARAALRRLADLGRDASEHDTARAGQELAQAGQRLYRHLFLLDRDAATTAEVRDWLAELANRKAIDSLEFLGNAPGLIPWNVLCESAPDESVFRGPDAPGWGSFWGVRYNLSSGRRVNALRQIQWLVKPCCLLVVDPQLRDGLPEPQQKRLREFVEVNHLPTAESLDQIVSAIRCESPELLYFFCRSSADGLLLHGADLTADDLEGVLRAEGSDIPWNNRILFINACRGPAAGAWEQTATRLHGLDLSGLILPEQPLPEGPANAFGLDFLGAFLYGREPVGKLLQTLRGRTAPLGVLYSSACPPALRVTWQEDEAPEDSAEEPAWPPLPDHPYRPLMPYDGEDRALFVGREDDTAAVAALLDAAATRIVVLHGRSGVGKSSLLRAGVIPYLEADNVGYRALRDRSEPEEGAEEDDNPVLAVRTTFDLPGQLAFALDAYCERPYSYTTPTGRTVSVDLPGLLQSLIGLGVQRASTAVQPAGQGTSVSPGQGVTAPADEDDLRTRLCEDPALLARLLSGFGERLPHEVVLLIEQGEEMFTLAQGREEAENRRLSLEMLHRLAASSGPGKVLLAMRTEYYGRLITLLRQDLHKTESVRDYFLTEMDEEAMIAAVVQPTLNEPIPFTDEIPFEKYHFRYEPGLPERIVREARQRARDRRESALSLLQVICAPVVDLAAAHADGTVLEADVKGVGHPTSRGWFAPPKEGGLAGYVQGLVDQAPLTSSDRKKLRTLLTRLFKRQPDGTLTRDLVPVEELAKEWKNALQLQRLLEAGEAEGVGLLETLWLETKDGERAFVSLTHDSLVAVTAQWEEDSLRGQAWTRTVDMLWIAIPLLILVVVYFWSFWVRPYNAKVEEFEAYKKVQVSKAKEQEMLERGIAGERWPLYVGQVALAGEAWKQGDVIRSRQLLLTQRNSLVPDVYGSADLRGFEWYYLWQLAHADRQTLVGHRGPVTSVSLTSDGKLLASAGQDGQVRLWDVPKGLERSAVRADAASVNALAFSGDGKLLASGGDDKSVKIWTVGADGIEEKVRATLSGHEGAVLAVAFSKDGNTVASGSADGTVRLWDVTQGKEQKTLKEHGGPVLAVAFSPDGKLLASGGADQTVMIWDAAGAKQHSLGAHGGSVRAVTFSPDGKLLLAGGSQKEGMLEGGVVKLWDPATGKEKSNVKQPAGVLALAFSKEGKTYAAGGKDKAVHLHDAATGKELKVLRGHLGWVDAVAFSADGETLVTAAFDGAIKLWPPTGPAPDVLQGHEGWVGAVAVSPDDKLAASGGEDGTVKLWESATGKEVRTLKDAGGPVLSVAFAKPADKLLVAAGVWSEKKDAGRVIVWDAEKGSVVHTLKGDGQAISGVAFSPDGKMLAAAGADGTLVVWDVAKGEVRHTFKGQKGMVRCVSFAPSGNGLASGGADGKVYLWVLAAPGEPIVTLEGHQGAVTAVAFAPDGRELISASVDHTIRRWDIKSGKTVVVMRGHASEVLSAAYSRKGEVIVSGGRDDTVRLWDVMRGEQRFVLTGHSGPVRGVAFSPDRRTSASASNDGTVRLWRAAQEAPAAMVGHPAVPPDEPEGEGP